MATQTTFVLLSKMYVVEIYSKLNGGSCLISINLQLDKLTDAMFYVAGELFNYKFIALEKGRIPVFHEDINVWKVQDSPLVNILDYGT